MKFGLMHDFRNPGPWQELPAHCGGVLNRREAVGCRGAQLHGCVGGFDPSARAPGRPRLLGELGEGHYSLPILPQPLHGFGGQLLLAGGDLCSERLAGRLGLSIRHRTQQRAGLGLVFLRHRVQHVGHFMVPAPWLGQGGRLLP